MSIIKVDNSNPDILKPKVFKVIPPGTYRFVVGNDLKVEPSKSSANNIVKIELKCLDEGEFRGETVFDNLVLGAEASMREKTEWKIAQFAVACGVCTKEDIQASGEIDLSLFKGKECDVSIGVRMSENPNTSEKQERSYVKQYMFED